MPWEGGGAKKCPKGTAGGGTGPWNMAFGSGLASNTNGGADPTIPCVGVGATKCPEGTVGGRGASRGGGAASGSTLEALFLSYNPQPKHTPPSSQTTTTWPAATPGSGLSKHTILITIKRSLSKHAQPQREEKTYITTVRGTSSCRCLLFAVLRKKPCPTNGAPAPYPLPLGNADRVSK